MLKMIKGARVPNQELLNEGYQFEGYNVYIASSNNEEVSLST